MARSGRQRTTNIRCRSYVQSRTPFQGHNLYGCWHRTNGNLFVVYSYGEHWPLFIHDHRTETWYENSDRHSVSTSKHRSQTHPCCVTVEATCDQLRDWLAFGDEHHPAVARLLEVSV